MKCCPNCGHKLFSETIDNTKVNKCLNCNFIDWDNWVNVSCVTVAYTKDKQFVMVKLKGAESGKITFPGGYRNLGETLESGAIREFYEETGIEAKQLSLYDVYTKDEQRLLWVIFKARVDNTNFINNNETSEIILVGKENYHLIDRNLFRGTLTERLFDSLKEWPDESNNN